MIDVCAVIERETGQKVTPETTLDELNVDSLEYLDLILTLEKESGKEIPVLSYRDLNTVGDMAKELS